MTAIVPSFVAKLDRAEKHIADLNEAIERYGGTHEDAASRPYTVRARVEGKKKGKVHRLHFTRHPTNTDIPLIAADAIYNLRSSLEHLAASMAPSKDRDSVTFPIFWRGVWDPFVEGENKQRRKDRQRWQTIERALPEDAVAYLKRLQPPDDGGKETHALRILNRFSNADRHTKLPVVAAGLEAMAMTWRMPNGSDVVTVAKANPKGFVENEAELKDCPKGAVNVDCIGTPVVMIRGEQVRRLYPVNYPLPLTLSDTLKFIREKVVSELHPYVRAPGGRSKRRHGG